jgi:hypothetical protein
MKISKIINWDKIGIYISSLCVIHCIATPFLLVFGMDSLIAYVENPIIEILLLLPIVAIGFFSFYKGFLHHRQHFLPVLFLSGFILLWCSESIENEMLTVAVSVMGGCIIVYAHYFNMILNRSKNAC